MDDIFEPRGSRIRRALHLLVPAVLPVILYIAFLTAISHTSEDTLAKEQDTLLHALENGAVHTYALTGSYPESLSELLEEYHITYDREKFVVEYVPCGSNLFPSISVLPLSGGTNAKGGFS